MKKSELADLLADNVGHDDPELVKVDIQVRSGGVIVPPSRARPKPDLRDAAPNVKVHRSRKEE